MLDILLFILFDRVFGNASITISEPPMIESVTESKQTQPLLEHEMLQDPIVQFQNWFEQARNEGVVQPETMSLATCTKEGIPSARMVFLRGLDERGFVFFTNYESRKAHELLSNPVAALVLYWEPFHRQVRIEGRVERTSDEESDSYFSGRPRGSQLSAWASPQSQVLSDRQELEERFQEAHDRHKQDDPVPRPPFWGGFRVVPQVIEFWQGRPNRLHDRLRFSRNTDQSWRCERLAP